MEWDARVNLALAYIEDNLCHTIDEKDIAHITLCPVGILQRFFVLNYGATLTEYIRRRRISKAASEILHTRTRLVDIANKYGYDSSESLCVVFKRYFGIAPSTARNNNVDLKLYPRISFTLTVIYDDKENK